MFFTIFYHLIINIFFITCIANCRNQEGQFWPNKPIRFWLSWNPFQHFWKIKQCGFLNVFSTVFIYTLLSSRQKKKPVTEVNLHSWWQLLYLLWLVRPRGSMHSMSHLHPTFLLCHYFTVRPIIKWFLNAKNQLYSLFSKWSSQ